MSIVRKSPIVSLKLGVWCSMLKRVVDMIGMKTMCRNLFLLGV